MKLAWKLYAVKTALKPSLQATLYVVASINMGIAATAITLYKSLAEAADYSTVGV